MKWLAVALAALVLGGCAKSIDNQDAAQKAVDEYFSRKPELRTMSARVQNVIFRGTEADATVMVTGKGADPSTAIPIPYILERKSSGWEVKGPSKNAMAGHAAQNGGQMPPGHPGAGAAPDGSPQGMPPGHPAMGSAPGAGKGRKPETESASGSSTYWWQFEMKVAVLGGGPSGAFAAERLAAAGVRTVLIDEKLAWEKPCGGGLTYKAYHEYPFLIDNDTPKKIVSETVLAAPKVGSVALHLRDPLVIYSRYDLNNMLLCRAEKAGAQLEKTRITEMARSGAGWKLRTKSGTIDADFCLLATGARNPLRCAGTTLTPQDAMSALGYFVPGTRDKIDIQFLENLEGYIWVFPRSEHLSVGICGKGVPAADLRKRLELYMEQHSLLREGSTFYSHLLPSLETPAWKQNRVAGDGWMAVGDAAGLVDPITGEGLYYAMRSADLATRTLLNEAAEKTEQAYRWLLRRDFAADLELGSRLAQRIFHGHYLFGAVPGRMIQFTRRSPSFRAVMQDLFSGTQNYIGLKGRLLRNLNGSLFEILGSFGFGRLVPRKDSVA